MRKLARGVGSLLTLAYVLSFFAVEPMYAQMEPTLADDAAASTVLLSALVTKTEDGASTEYKQCFLGSGSIVSADSRYILTNYHVVRYIEKANSFAEQTETDAIRDNPGRHVDFRVQEIVVSVVDHTGAIPLRQFRATVVKQEEALDLALLRITGDSPGRDYEGSLRRPYFSPDLSPAYGGQTVTLIGYPALAPSSLDAPGCAHIPDTRSIQLFPGSVSGFSGPNLDQIVVTAPGSGGMSGGSAVDETGRLIGIPAEIQEMGAGGVIEVIPIERATAMLDDVIPEVPTPTSVTPAPVSPVPSPPTPTGPAELTAIVITTDVVNLREEPSTASSILLQLPKSTPLQVTGDRTGSEPTWWPVKDLASGQSGFVRADLVELQAPGTGRLAYAAKVSGAWGIFVYDFATGSTTQSARAAGTDQIAPAWSHDGKHLAFISAATGESPQVWITNADQTESQQITNYAGDGTIHYVEWSAGDQNLIVTVAGDGVAWLMTVPVSGGDLQALVPAPASHPAVTTDGRMVLVTVGGPNLDLVLTDETGNPIGVVAKDVEWEDTPSISPDGRSVAYQIGPKGARRIGISPIDGGPATFLPQIGSDDSNPVWSPDGATLALVANQDGRNSVWITPLDGGESRRLILNEAEDIWYLSWTA